MSGITYLTRNAWNEWHLDRDLPISDSTARCDACGRDVTIGKVGAFVPAVDDKPVELICETCAIEPYPADDVQNEDDSETWETIAHHHQRRDEALEYVRPAQELIARMLSDGLITRKRGGELVARSYGREALMLLSTLIVREASGLPNRDR